MTPHERLAKAMVADAALRLPPGRWKKAVRTAFLVRRELKTQAMTPSHFASAHSRLSRDWMNWRDSYRDMRWFLSPRCIPWVEAAGFEYDEILKQLRDRDMLPPEGTVV